MATPLDDGCADDFEAFDPQREGLTYPPEVDLQPDREPDDDDGTWTYSVEIGDALVITQKPNRRDAIMAVLDQLPDDVLFNSGDTLTIVCTRLE